MDGFGIKLINLLIADLEAMNTDDIDENVAVALVSGDLGPPESNTLEALASEVYERYMPTVKDMPKISPKEKLSESKEFRGWVYRQNCDG